MICGIDNRTEEDIEGSDMQTRQSDLTFNEHRILLAEIAQSMLWQQRTLVPTEMNFDSRGSYGKSWEQRQKTTNSFYRKKTGNTHTLVKIELWRKISTFEHFVSWLSMKVYCNFSFTCFPKSKPQVTIYKTKNPYRGAWAFIRVVQSLERLKAKTQFMKTIVIGIECAFPQLENWS